MSDFEYGTPEWNGSMWMFELRRGFDLTTRIKSTTGRKRIGAKTINVLANNTLSEPGTRDARKLIATQYKLGTLVGSRAEVTHTGLSDETDSLFGVVRSYNLSAATITLKTPSGLVSTPYPTEAEPYDPFSDLLRDPNTETGEPSLFPDATTQIFLRTDQLYKI